jgi:twitching motility protein PilT
MASTLAGFLRWMDASGANTLYLGENIAPMIRVNGQLSEVDSGLLNEREMEACVRRFSPDEAWSEFEEKGHAEFTCAVPGKRRCRINIFKKLEGFGAVIRLESIILPKAEHHGMPKLFDRIAKQESGVVIVAGPRASGRTTFLHSILDHINENRSAQIVSLERPIGWKHVNRAGMVIQREFGGDLPSRLRTLAGIHSLSADVVVIDGLEPGPEACAVFDGSFSDYLMVVSVRAPSLIHALEALALGAPESGRSQLRKELSRNLLVGVGQNIVKDIEGGRRASREILFPSPAVRELIKKGQFRALPKVMRDSRKQGMVALDDYLHQMVKVGFADPEHAYEIAFEPARLRDELKKNIGITVGSLEPTDGVAKKMMADLVAAARSRRT